MSLPLVVSRDEWLVARRELLAREKAATRERDALNAQRRALPMVEIDKEYVFEGPEGRVSLLDLFAGHRQLIVYHFMFDPSWDEGCPSCSLLVDNIGHLAHLYARDTSLAVVSRAPLAKIEPFKTRMGWTVPWYSSQGSDFNYDFHVTLDGAVAPVEYNYRDRTALEQAGEAWFRQGEQPGVSVFLRDGDRIFHTYSTYARGGDVLLGTYTYLDLTPLGRQEDWEAPPGRSDGPFMWWVLHHDNYDARTPSAPTEPPPMTALPDLEPAARQMARLLDGVTDDQLTAPTPCDEYTLGDLIDHVSGLSQAFTGAANKNIGPGTSQGPSGDAARLDHDWRTRVPKQLTALAEAWRNPDAWEGMTQAGGIDLPAEMAGTVALNELVIHGWDVARASGQPFDCDPQALDASMEFVSLMSTEDAAGREGLFGPVLDIPADAPLLNRAIGLSGRDPSWSATASNAEHVEKT